MRPKNLIGGGVFDFGPGRLVEDLQQAAGVLSGPEGGASQGRHAGDGLRRLHDLQEPAGDDNDDFGHPAGDEALRLVAATLSEVIRESDVAARYGGEEFAVLLPATGSDEAGAIAERLRAAIAAHEWPSRPTTASFGVATTGPAAPDAGQLVAEADRALYRSKGRGRDRITHHRDLYDSSADNGDGSDRTSARLALAAGR